MEFKRILELLGLPMVSAEDRKKTLKKKRAKMAQVGKKQGLYYIQNNDNN
jgi:hypothetical protein